MAILHIKDKDGNFVRISSTPGKSAYEIAVEKGLFVGTEQEFAEMQVFQNKEILDQITQENIDRWNSGVGGDDIDLSNYVTETELEEKGYLTEHQDISHKADRTELHNHSNKTVLDTITEQIVSEWNNKSEFSGDYDDLTNKPNIPSIEGLATKEELPTRTSELTNDSNFTNERYVNDAISSLEKIQLSDTTPTNTDVAIWINTSEDTANNPLARVNDEIVSDEHTWSSEKIYQHIMDLTEKYNDLLIKYNELLEKVSNLQEINDNCLQDINGDYLQGIEGNYLIFKESV